MVSGPGLEAAPHSRRAEIGTYYNDFATLPLDVNGDGHTDFITVSYFGKNIGWVQNPGKTDAPWTYHEIDVPGTSEAAAYVDLTGDGIPDVLPNPTNVVAWYEVAKSKKDSGKGFEIVKHDFGTQAAGHGVGSGDVNGDGRVDLLTPKGWFEAPSDPARKCHVDLAPRLEAGRHRHPDPGSRRGRRRPGRPGLRHGS